MKIIIFVSLNDKLHLLIIFFNSVTGHMGIFLPSTAMYSASKHAVLLLTEGLRKEVVQLKTKIRVAVSVEFFSFCNFKLYFSFNN